MSFDSDDAVRTWIIDVLPLTLKEALRVVEPDLTVPDGDALHGAACPRTVQRDSGKSRIDGISLSLLTMA